MTGDDEVTGALLNLIPGDNSTELRDVTATIQPLNKSVIILDMFHGSHAKEKQQEMPARNILMNSILSQKTSFTKLRLLPSP